MNKHEKEVAKLQLDAEKIVLDALLKVYKRALRDISSRIKFLQSDELTQSSIYRKSYQEALKAQVEAIIEKLHADEYQTIEEYLKECYTDAYIGTAYSLAQQGLPLILPIDQNAVVKAIMTDSKIDGNLYSALGVDTTHLKQVIAQEISRGIVSNMAYFEIARNITNQTGIPYRRARTITITEAHRIQQAATEDVRQAAKARGCDIVKQWDATLDGKTRDTHRRLDGQIKEAEEPFEIDGKKAMYPGGFGRPEEDCNCRCVALTRAKWALDADELKTMQERAAYFGLDKTDSFEDFKKKYLDAMKEDK